MIHKSFTTIIIFFLVLVVYLPVKINSEAVNVAETSKYTYDVKHSRIESKNIKKEIMAYRKRLKSLVDKY